MDFIEENTVEPHNSGQVGCPEIVPYCGVFPYFASSLFTNGHFGHSGFVPYFASFPYFASPYFEHLPYNIHRVVQTIVETSQTVNYQWDIAFSHYLGQMNYKYANMQF